MDYQYILVDVKDRIATVTINRPEYSNAFARESYFEIADAMNTLGAREDVGAIVITGAGKHFSAGGDIKRFKMLVDTGAYLKAEDIEAVSAMPIYPQLPETSNRHDKRCCNRCRIKLRTCLRFPYCRTIQQNDHGFRKYGTLRR